MTGGLQGCSLRRLGLQPPAPRAAGTLTLTLTLTLSLTVSLTISLTLTLTLTLALALSLTARPQACRSSAVPPPLEPLGSSAAKESERSSGASDSFGLTAETLRWRGFRPLLWLDGRPELPAPLPPDSGGCGLAASCAAARCLMVRCKVLRISYGPCSTYSVHASPPARHSTGSGGSSLVAKASTDSAAFARGWADGWVVGEGDGWGDPAVILR